MPDMEVLQFVKRVLRAPIFPADRNKPVSPLRALVSLPILFDLVSLVLQTRDLARLKKILSSYSVDDEYHRAVHDYNAGVTLNKLITTTRRAERYYELLACPRRDLVNEKLLIIGPRNIHECLLAWTHGWGWRSITAIDLYSTNPKIKVMNMEEMTFEKGSFDSVSMANTLSYSKDTRSTIRSVAWVIKEGGYFAFGATFDPSGQRWLGDRIDGASLVRMLHDEGFEICAHLARDKRNSEGRIQTSHDYLARKIPNGEQRLDPFFQ